MLLKVRKCLDIEPPKPLLCLFENLWEMLRGNVLLRDLVFAYHSSRDIGDWDPPLLFIEIAKVGLIDGCFNTRQSVLRESETDIIYH